MRPRVTGLCCFCIGIGMIAVVVIPAFGWIVITGIGLVCAGYMLFKC